MKLALDCHIMHNHGGVGVLGCGGEGAKRDYERKYKPVIH